MKLVWNEFLLVFFNGIVVQNVDVSEKQCCCIFEVLIFLICTQVLVVSRNCSKISHSKILMCKKMTKNYEVGTLYSKNCTIVKKLTWYKNLIAFLPADW